MSPNIFKRLFCCIAAEDDALPPPSIITTTHRPRPSPPAPPPPPPAPPAPAAPSPPPITEAVRSPLDYLTHDNMRATSGPRITLPRPPPTPPPHDKNFFKGNGSWRESDTIKRIQAGPFADDPPPRRRRRAKPPPRVPSPPPPRKPIWQIRMEGAPSRQSSDGSLVTVVPDDHKQPSPFPAPKWGSEMKKNTRPYQYRFPFSSDVSPDA